ncbi:MAG: sugar ABC transporter permease [Clostridiales bacterium]|jgi:multiple sugar transport system permease protein|nr:sugar ABC transporter permease [Clostridiales bacterium]
MSEKAKNAISGWLIMLPALILFGFFVWEPLFESVRMSLYNAKGYTLTEFVGLANYRSLFASPDFVIAWKNTFMYIVWSLIIGFIVPIVIAVLITESPILKSVTRVAVYFPNMLPGLAIVMIWAFFLKPGDMGVLNILMSKIGIKPFTWLTTKGWTIPLIVLTMTWKSAGSTALIYMARISDINPELIEAAAIDGAGPLRRMFSIVIPSLFGLVKTMLILQIISVFQILYEPLMMTNGGPNNASVSIMMQVYRYAFDQFNYPKAAAVSVMINIVLTLITIVYFTVTREKEEAV